MKHKKFMLILLATAGVIAVIVGVVLVIFLLNNRDQIDSEIKTPHFLDSTPMAGDVYAAQPINVTLNFDFDLAEGSDIRVMDADGNEWTESEPLITDANTALQKELAEGMGDGTYTVEYTACWPDDSCHDGRFSFAIDSSLLGNYTDMRGQSEVAVDMHDIMFDKKDIIISPNTKVTWLNMDEVIHFVNTETHPEHTYYPPQNSRGIEKDQTFSATFETPGQYNYHCSAHAEQMRGSIIVQE